MAVCRFVTLAWLSWHAAVSESRGSSRTLFNEWWVHQALPLLKPCREAAEKQGVFGDVIVSFVVQRDRALVRTWASRQVGKQLERCVSGALQRVAADMFVLIGARDSQDTVLTLGTLRPLLPAAQVLTPRWTAFAAATTPAARARSRALLARVLPPDVRPGAGAC